MNISTIRFFNDTICVILGTDNAPTRQKLAEQNKFLHKNDTINSFMHSPVCSAQEQMKPLNSNEILVLEAEIVTDTDAEAVEYLKEKGPIR